MTGQGGPKTLPAALEAGCRGRWLLQLNAGAAGRAFDGVALPLHRSRPTPPSRATGMPADFGRIWRDLRDGALRLGNAQPMSRSQCVAWVTGDHAHRHSRPRWTNRLGVKDRCPMTKRMRTSRAAPDHAGEVEPAA